MSKTCIILAHAAAAGVAVLDHPLPEHGKSHTMVVMDDLMCDPVDPKTQKSMHQLLTERSLMVEAAPPRRLSNNPNHKDYHPSFVRIGVRVDGKERNDLTWYDQAGLRYSTDRALHNNSLHVSIKTASSIEPYWRFQETRQQRRARERWEAKR